MADTDYSQLASAYRGDALGNLSDLGNAERLVRYYGERVRYCTLQRRWYLYDPDSGRWIADETNAIMALAKEVVRGMIEEAKTLPDNDRTDLIRHSLRSEAERGLRAMISLAESEPGIPVRPNEFDADPLKLNVLNGVIDLLTGALLPHHPDYLITHLAPVAYDPTAECPTWIRFLDRVFAGDAALIEFVRRVFGYTLTGLTREQILLFLYGLGANGKSVFITVLRTLLGTYAAQAAFETFEERQRSGANNDVARLAGRRFVAAVEASEGRRLAESLVKQATGGDTMVARHLYCDYFEFVPQFKLWLVANHKPEIRGTDLAIWRRICLIPFAVTIPEDERDDTLSDRLHAELPGILRWAIEGCIAWQREGLERPAAVRVATEQYRSEMDVLGPFFEARCTLAANAIAGATPLYRAYIRWAEAAGERPMTQTRFGRALAERGLVKEKVGTGLVAWLGIALRPSEDDAFSDSSDSSGGFSRKSHREEQ